jgi:hypothetical protein
MAAAVHRIRRQAGAKGMDTLSAMHGEPYGKHRGSSELFSVQINDKAVIQQDGDRGADE